MAHAAVSTRDDGHGETLTFELPLQRARGALQVRVATARREEGQVTGSDAAVVAGLEERRDLADAGHTGAQVPGAELAGQAAESRTGAHEGLHRSDLGGERRGERAQRQR